MGSWYTITDPFGQVTIDFNEVDENGLLIPDDNGTVWSVEELLGVDSADVRQVTLDKFGNDGISMAVDEFSSRTLTLSNGFGMAVSEDARYAAREELATLLAATLPRGPCLVTIHEDIDRFCYAYMTSKHNFKDSPEGAVAGSGRGLGQPDGFPFQFDASLVCPDPLKYSVNGASPTILARDAVTSVFQMGDYPTWPTLTVAYPCDGDFIIDQTARGVIFTNQYRSGSNANMPDLVTIDFENKTVVDQTGASAWDTILSAFFFQLAPDLNGGAAIIYQLGSSSPNGIQEASIEWFDAWV